MSPDKVTESGSSPGFVASFLKVLQLKNWASRNVKDKSIAAEYLLNFGNKTFEKGTEKRLMPIISKHFEFHCLGKFLLKVRNVKQSKWISDS